MDSTLASLAAWMPRQRWYAAKGRTPHLRHVASWEMPGDEPGVRARTLILTDEGTLPAISYQVPVVSRPTETVPHGQAAHVIGHPEPGTTLIDAPHDPAYSSALLQLITRGGTVRAGRTVAVGHPSASSPHLGAALEAHRAAVLTGEQSNTSVCFRFADGAPPIICKIYRQLQSGTNPDIELNNALSDARSPHVPRAVGWLECSWTDAGAPSRLTGSLAFAQEFLPDVEDAWRLALRSAAESGDFSRPAFDLGAATADVHRSLAHLFPTAPATALDRAAMRDAWQRRLSTAIAEVPALVDARRAIEAVYDRALDVEWPPLQRIHGDYHLGQVLAVPDRGWVLLDFEGEPMRAMAERTAPDLALRDVAGMLRSFEYVAGSVRIEHPDQTAALRDWADNARDGFLAGYADRARPRAKITGALLNALELDKAVYEAVYESRSRPTWLTIPLRAVERLVTASSAR
ncbi:phosphotransferase [Microbacterium sp. zg.Y1090]|uniref:maltokinase N-terminal cap-like domain-containing protein n=1 Tax=Microbacterium TaxID=33882 RepID=UPI00214BB506|nr:MULTISPECIES: phosphotransferase [unclassified Microbacterium]MCR2812035.1 phosphotransferase [Microbacterium sp. zg.Y1084]MCR2818526.1 phosphotransferase [Microbacterium sp. zg.Y1090]MDL5486339.1 phosphotransferase [Microbacterium sp. zg-Y1211]WIM29534.1 phosphotransferase [Microbacterium sp. zg-Y1090]